MHGQPGPEAGAEGRFVEQAREVILAPLLTRDGRCARVVLPRAFGLAAPVTLRFGRRFTLCPPLGLLPDLTRLIVARAVARAPKELLSTKASQLSVVLRRTAAKDKSRDQGSRNQGIQWSIHSERVC